MWSERQVVLDFSRRGCPHCARQVPVLQQVIRARAAQLSGTAFVGSLASAPLRVFLLDAEDRRCETNGRSDRSSLSWPRDFRRVISLDKLDLRH